MKITLESTEKIISLQINGVDVPARIWQGHTAAGVEVHAYITRVAVARSLDAAEFERDLQEHALPRQDLAAIPLRLII